MRERRRAPGRFSLSDGDTQRFGDGDVLVFDRVLGPDLAAGLARELPAYRELVAPAGMGRGAARWLDRDQRGDEMAWIEKQSAPPAASALLGVFDAVRDALNREAYMGLRRFDVQVARYRGNGAGYARHADAFSPRYGVSRRATAIYYANPTWRPEHGGLLRAFVGDRTVDIEPRLDRLVLFASERVEHEVTPCHAERWAVTAWYYAGD